MEKYVHRDSMYTDFFFFYIIYMLANCLISLLMQNVFFDFFVYAIQVIAFLLVTPYKRSDSPHPLKDLQNDAEYDILKIRTKLEIMTSNIN